MRASVWVILLTTPALASVAEERVTVAVSSAAVALDLKAYGTAKLDAAVAMSEASAGRMRAEQQFGRNDKKWPQSERDKVQQLVDKEDRTKFAANYMNGAGLDVKAMDGIVEAVVKEVGKSKTLQMAGSPEKADLAIELLGCIADGSNAGLGTRLRPGARLDAAALATAIPTFKPRGGQVKGGFWSTNPWKAFTAAEPFWLIASVYPGISKDLPLSCSYSGAALVVSLEAFVKDSSAALIKARVGTAAGR